MLRLLSNLPRQVDEGVSAPGSHPLLIVALCLIAGMAIRLALRQRRELAKIQGRIENLKFELEKMAHLPLNHPRRKTLVDEVMSAMRPVKDQLDRVLFPHHEAFDELDWMHKLKHRKFPYSITDEEGLILYNLVTRLGLRNGYEVATAFGYSSFYLGLAFKKNGGRLVSLDAYVEESQEHFVYDEETARSHAEAHIAARYAGETEKLPEGLRFALAGANKLGLEETTRYEIGFSPMSIPSTLKDEIIDFAFIDGSHFGEAPREDVDAVLPYLNSNRCIIVFHDTHCEAVAKAVFHAAERLGGEIHSINTRNRLVVVTRNADPKVIEECRQIVVRQCK